MGAPGWPLFALKVASTWRVKLVSFYVFLQETCGVLLTARSRMVLIAFQSTSVYPMIANCVWFFYQGPENVVTV